MIRETAVTNQELAGLHSDCATHIEEPWRETLPHWLAKGIITLSNIARLTVRLS